MEWSADTATRHMLSELDPRTTNGGAMMVFFRGHLQAAFDAGRNQEADAWREHVMNRFRRDNTEGFSPAQLAAMNNEFNLEVVRALAGLPGAAEGADENESARIRQSAAALVLKRHGGAA